MMTESAMLLRRQLLLSVSVLAVIPGRRAFAFLPVILAALAAVTALAFATGKAADALQAAVHNGERLWTVLKSIPDDQAVANQLADRQRSLREEIGIRREVVTQAKQSQRANASVVSSVRFYLINRDSSAWAKVVPALNSAATVLQSMAIVFREKAAWFPAEAQQPLGELPDLYEENSPLLGIFTDFLMMRRLKLIRSWTLGRS